MRGLEEIDGLGPAKIAKLHAAGIESLKDLAELDLRKPIDAGVGKEVLRKAKNQARRILAKEGHQFAKANYDRPPGDEARPWWRRILRSK